MLTTDLETVEEKSVLPREKNRIVVLMKQKAWTSTEEVITIFLLSFFTAVFRY